MITSDDDYGPVLTAIPLRSLSRRQFRTEATRPPTPRIQSGKLLARRKAKSSQIQHERNYVAPIDQLLARGGRLLDVGCGTGIWAKEMAKEFPQARVTAIDVRDTLDDQNKPTNLDFEVQDVTRGLNFPDDTFDVIHCRLLMVGVKNWQALVEEIARLVKPGGLLAFVESGTPWPLPQPENVDDEPLARGFVAFRELVEKALVANGYDIQAGSITLPRLLRENLKVEKEEHVVLQLPWWRWSEEPHLRTAGEIMIHNARHVPESIRPLCQTSLGMGAEAYNKVAEGWERCLGKEGLHASWPIHYNWAWKKV